jgi:peptidoglycan/LPS O-acetylase OafA/YrhL
VLRPVGKVFSPPLVAEIRSRLAFLDLLRAVAIVLMVFAHVNDALLEPLEWQSALLEASTSTCVD